MTPRPLHRWKSFWLGILVVCFFAGAWKNSLGFESWMNWSMVTASSGGGAVYVSYHPHRTASLTDFEWGRSTLGGGRYFDITASAFPSPRVIRGGGRDLLEVLLESRASAQDASEGSTPFPALLEESFVARPRGDWLVFIPYWLVMLGFVVPWAGFLFWKWRRTRNLTIAS